MSSLPEGWESDYDGSRWYFRYKATGAVQFNFPQPGDEFPQFYASFDPVRDNYDPTPEERLASEKQTRRQTVADPASAQPQLSRSRSRSQHEDGLDLDMMAAATLGGSDFFSSFDAFSFLGPGAYNDASPVHGDGEEKGVSAVEESHQPRPTQQTHQGPIEPQELESFHRQSIVSLGDSLPSPSPGTAIHSNSTTPSLMFSDTATGDAAIAITAPPVTVPPAMANPAADIAVEVAELPSTTASSSQYDPVGFVSELPAESTPQCLEETNPTPVELPDSSIILASIPEFPVELPHEPIQKPVQNGVLPPRPGQEDRQQKQQQLQSEQKQDMPYRPFRSSTTPITEMEYATKPVAAVGRAGGRVIDRRLLVEEHYSKPDKDLSDAPECLRAPLKPRAQSVGAVRVPRSVDVENAKAGPSPLGNPPAVPQPPVATRHASLSKMPSILKPGHLRSSVENHVDGEKSTASAHTSQRPISTTASNPDQSNQATATVSETKPAAVADRNTLPNVLSMPAEPGLVPPPLRLSRQVSVSSIPDADTQTKTTTPGHQVTPAAEPTHPPKQPSPPASSQKSRPISAFGIITSDGAPLVPPKVKTTSFGVILPAQVTASAPSRPAYPSKPTGPPQPAIIHPAAVPNKSVQPRLPMLANFANVAPPAPAKTTLPNGVSLGTGASPREAPVKEEEPKYLVNESWNHTIAAHPSAVPQKAAQAPYPCDPVENVVAAKQPIAQIPCVSVQSSHTIQAVARQPALEEVRVDRGQQRQSTSTHVTGPRGWGSPANYSGDDWAGETFD